MFGCLGILYPPILEKMKVKASYAKDTFMTTRRLGGKIYLPD